MTSELTLTNARIVLADRVLDGHVVMRAGTIAEIGEGAARSGEDMGGDYLLPGLVELHTDHLESHYLPRPKVQWNKMASIQAHDAQVAASGITTVFDALRVGSDENAGITGPDMREMADTIGAVVHSGRLRADHYIHLRCEVSASDVIEGFESLQGNERLRLASLMDHAPGQRQFTILTPRQVRSLRPANILLTGRFSQKGRSQSAVRPDSYLLMQAEPNPTSTRTPYDAT